MAFAHGLRPQESEHVLPAEAAVPRPLRLGTVAPPGAGLEALMLTFQLQGRLVGLLSAEGRPHGLNATEVLALVVLAQEATPVSGIARAVGVRPNGASVLVDRLKERRLVRRQRSRRDSRVVTVDLTDVGRELAATLTVGVSEQAAAAFGPLAAEERQQIVASLARLVRAPSVVV